MRLKLFIVATLLAVPACVAPQTAPSLDLKYAPVGRTVAPRNNIAIVLLKPRYAARPLVSNDLEKEISPADTVPEIYNTKQSPRLEASLQTDMGNLFNAKGFLVSKTSGSFDALPATDKQKIDLVATTVFDFGPLVTNNQNAYRYPTGDTRYTNTGSIQITGTLTIEFKEPGSHQTIMTKKIDVTALSSNLAGEYEDQAEAESKFIELLNKVYPRLMAKIDKSINADELQAALAKRKQLKDKNQPAPTENKPL